MESSNYFNTPQRQSVPKTTDEKVLCDYYMGFIESDDIIPENVVKQFKDEVLVIAKQNTRYLGID